MTFIVGWIGLVWWVYQKDRGEDAADVVKSDDAYGPGSSWKAIR
jgi:hypothetical protein